MFAAIIDFANLLFAALLVGAMFAVWLVFNPAGLNAGTYVALHQQGVRTLHPALPILGDSHDPGDRYCGGARTGRQHALLVAHRHGAVFRCVWIDHAIPQHADQRRRDDLE